MSNYKCQFCDYESNKKYNLTRHMDIKHMQQKVSPVQQKVSHEDIHNILSFTCNNCNKSYKKQWILNRHIKKCTGIKDPLLCNFCNTIFTCKSSKSKHLKICKEKSTALIVRPPDENTVALSGQQITNNNNINSNNTIITNNIGTVNYNIVIYNDKKTPFKKDHISQQKLRHILYNNTDETVFSKYNSEIMERPENNCIRKSDKRSNYSQIHVGENKWKNIPDKKIYPEIISQIAEDMQDVVNDEFENLKSKEKLFDLLDYFIFKETSDDNKEAERRFKRIYNLIVEEQKLYAIEAAVPTKTS